MSCPKASVPLLGVVLLGGMAIVTCSVEPGSPTILYAWGRNNFAQLGRGTHDFSFQEPAPALVCWSGGVKAVAGGGSHCVLLAPDGRVWVWGLHYGSKPTRLRSVNGVKAIAAGTDHAIALTQDGRVVTWGRNHCGQLGRPPFLDAGSPDLLRGLEGVIAVDACEDYCVALKADGSVWTWGDNGSGELGDGTTKSRWRPAKVGEYPGATEVAAGFWGPAVLKADGTVWSLAPEDIGDVKVDVGSDGYGYVFPGTRDRQVHGLHSVKAIAAGLTYVALKSDGTVWAWGGDVGDGTRGWQPRPTRVEGVPEAADIDACHMHVVVAGTDGTVWGWGVNFSGESSGRMDARKHLAPVQVEAIAGAIAVAAGSQFSLALCRGE